MSTSHKHGSHNISSSSYNNKRPLSTITKSRSEPPSSKNALYERHKTLVGVSSSKNIVMSSDYEELKKTYRFIMPAATAAASSQSENTTTTWQERMAMAYHNRLFKEYALADLSRYKTGAVGLRWRTKQEVIAGRGHFTCGNKHCPSDGLVQPEEDNEVLRDYYSYSPKTEEEERKRLCSVPYGNGLYSYEVNFAYEEDEVRKNELVKLRLCLRCAPLLFHTKGGALAARKARSVLDCTDPGHDTPHTKRSQRRDYSDSSSTSSSSSSTSDENSKLRRRYRSRKEKRKRKKSVKISETRKLHKKDDNHRSTKLHNLSQPGKHDKNLHQDIAATMRDLLP